MTPDLSRREFLALAAAALAGTAAGGCAGVPMLQPRIDEDDWVSISLDEFTTNAGENRAVVVDAPGRKYPVLVTYHNGQFYALSARCTHQGCKVKPSKGFLVCSCHGSSFTLEGDVVRGPASTALHRLPASLDKGRIYVDVSA